MTSEAKNWSAYWKTRDIDSSLEGAGVEHHALIHQYWDRHLSHARKDARLIDLACGAGTVVKRAIHAGLTNLSAMDYAPEALAILKTHLPDVDIHQASLTDHKLPPQSFDWVVSQFGIEYAGTDGFRAAARLVAPGGEVVLLCHAEEGGIHREVSADVAFAQGVIDTQFVSRAKQFAEREYRSKTFDQSTEHFKELRQAAETLARMDQTRPGQFAGHLLGGFHQLIDRRFSYDLSDITGWLDGMAVELDSYHGRMQAMLDAAIPEGDLAKLRAVLEDEGLINVVIEPFPQAADQETFGWAINAKRPRLSVD